MFAKLDSETGWTVKLRSKTNLHKCQNYETDFFFNFLGPYKKKLRVLLIYFIFFNYIFIYFIFLGFRLKGTKVIQKLKGA